MSAHTSQAAFDAYSGNYHEALQRGVQLSGEDPSYFADQRVALLGERLRELDVRPETVLDFGCGTGSTVPRLRDLPGAQRVIGTDASAGLLEEAQRDHATATTTFVAMSDPLEREIDLAYCNGVFHHIAPSGRPHAVAYVRDSLRPGGLFALWENNPWNPGTRLVMRRIPFDRDAVTLTAATARSMLEAGGFQILHTDYAFIFPHVLRALRRFERQARALPLGAQYMVLARRV